MRISLIQTEIVWADKTANLSHIEKKIESLSGKTDLIVLPEMFTTGFCVDQLNLAETMDGETVSKLKFWAHRFNVAITGSFIAKEANNNHNRAFFTFPDGRIQTADKRHLFSVGGENKYFSSGNVRLIVNYKGFKICILVCYDIRFPVWSRNRNNEYDLLIYTASFPHARIYAWNALLKARAIENQSFVCGVNRIGMDGNNIFYSGHSVLLDFKGKELAGFPELEDGIVTGEIIKDELDKYREKYAFWKDADDFIINDTKF